MSRFFKIIATISLLMTATNANAGLSRRLITESTVTIGRGGRGGDYDFVPVADIGERFIKNSRVGYGYSIMVGPDLPNDAWLLGLRGRWSHHGRKDVQEVSLAIVSTSAPGASLGTKDSFGASFAVAHYPVKWAAVVLQLDMIPTRVDSSYGQEEFSRDPALSGGIRLAEIPGWGAWLGTGVAILAYIAGKEWSDTMG